MIFPQQKTPLTISGLVCWFDASDTPVGAVASWTDKSGFNRHAIQATGANQLTCTANQQAGRNALIGTRAAASYMKSTFGFTTSANCTIFYVAKKTSLATGGGNDILFDGIGSTNRQSLLEAVSTAKFNFGTNTATAGADVDTDPHIHTMQGGTTGNYWIDGTAQFTDTNIGSLGVDGLTINARFTLGNACDISLNEIIYYNQKLGTADRVKIQQYLSNKWGIGIS